MYCQNLTYVDYETAENHDFEVVASSNSETAIMAMKHSGGSWVANESASGRQYIKFALTN